MGADRSVDDVDRELATAFGLYALSDATLNEAAAETDVTTWELEVAIERAGLEAVFGLDDPGDISTTIDELVEDD